MQVKQIGERCNTGERREFKQQYQAGILRPFAQLTKTIETGRGVAVETTSTPSAINRRAMACPMFCGRDAPMTTAFLPPKRCIVAVSPCRQAGIIRPAV
jgi:hypothetical protein